jgi:Right handed beta helix region
VGTIVRSNHIRGAGEDGLHIDRQAKHTLLKRNHAFGAKDDGLDVNNSTTTLTGNRARRNGDLGIEAVFGAIDGGGNLASGNGNPLQCLNITCH